MRNIKKLSEDYKKQFESAYFHLGEAQEMYNIIEEDIKRETSQKGVILSAFKIAWEVAFMSGYI